jgi:transcriptional antiterminator RfaH
MLDSADSSKASGSWYAVHCRYLKEFSAESFLRETLGLVTYLPTVMSRVHGVTKETPFFPGYLFVEAALGGVKLRSINTAPGVIRLVEFGGERRPVPAAVISGIREQLDALNAQGGLPDHNFQVGDTVSLRSGPLSGLQASFLGPMTPGARVKILLEFLGRLTEVAVDVAALTTVQQHSRPSGQRRTRGRGRRIRMVEGVGNAPV